MRFKCVSKQWQSFIHKDRSFTDLHFTRSKTSNFALGGAGISLFIRWPRHKYFSSAKPLLSEGGGLAAVQREIPKPGASLTHVFGAVNGLISSVNRSTSYVCVLNPSTGQSTPWIQPTFRQQHDRVQYTDANWYYFGYDPATMEHKVVLFWIEKISDCRGVFLRFQNICEVMTVDGRQHNNNLSWRRIDDDFSLPPKISPYYLTSSLYANGSIYWLRTGPEPSIVEFNVGSEKFRVISIPNYIIEETHYRYDCKLIQIDGRLAVLATTAWLSIDTMKMCVLYDKKLKDNIGSNASSTSSVAGSSVSNSGDGYWTEEAFKMPHSDWSRLQFDSIQAVPGTDLLIIKSEGHAGSTFYFYDWKKQKSLNKESFFIAKRKTSSLQPYSFEYFVYKESLLPVI